MSTIGWVILIGANVPVYWLIGWVIFGNWGEFRECIRYLLTPDIISLFRGERGEDWWAEMKLAYWVVLCGCAVYLESLLLAWIGGT